MERCWTSCCWTGFLSRLGIHSLCAGLARSFARGDQNRSPMLAERLRKLTNGDESAEKQALALKTTPPAAAGTRHVIGSPRNVASVVA